MEHASWAVVSLAYLVAALVLTVDDESWPVVAVVSGLTGLAVTCAILFYPERDGIQFSSRPPQSHVEGRGWTLLSVVTFYAPMILILFFSMFAWTVAAVVAGGSAGMLIRALVSAYETYQLEKERNADMFRVVPRRGRPTSTHVYVLTDRMGGRRS